MEGTGIDAQIGFAAEAAYGQFAAPTRFLPFRSEALTTEHARKVAEGLRPGRYGLRRGERRRGTINPSGDVVFDFADVGFGLLLQHMMGSVDTDEVEAGAVWDHTFTPGSLRELSLTAQVGVPDVEGTSNPKSVTGCKVTGWELGVSVDEYAQLTLSLVGQNESWSEALAAPVYPEAEPYDDLAASLRLAGDEIDVAEVSLSAGNALKDDRRRLGSRLRKVPLQNAIREYTGSFDAEYASPALYQHVITADELELVLLFTGDEIVPGFNYETEIRGWIQLDGDTPAVDGPDEIRQPISFTAAAEDFTIRYRTSTATL